MRLNVYRTKQEMGAAAAERAARWLNAAIATRGEANLILATGASQFEMLENLVWQDVDWSKVTVFHLDEYLGLPETHPASFRKYLKERFATKLPELRMFHYVNGEAADPAVECARLGDLIAAHPIDVACIGIGENGHLAFNDPPADFETPARVHIVMLDEACRRQQVGEGHFPTLADVPTRALSLTIPAILAARAISCVVPDRRKAEAVRCTLAGPITPACPASALRTHTNVRLYLDQESAALVDL